MSSRHHKAADIKRSPKPLPWIYYCEEPCCHAATIENAFVKASNDVSGIHILMFVCLFFEGGAGGAV